MCIRFYLFTNRKAVTTGGRMPTTPKMPRMITSDKRNVTPLMIGVAFCPVRFSNLPSMLKERSIVHSMLRVESIAPKITDGRNIADAHTVKFILFLLSLRMLIQVSLFLKKRKVPKRFRDRVARYPPIYFSKVAAMVVATQPIVPR